jgi:pyruvate/2-oxoglutarate dehydrogenase complex dihydrolipoamide dehydrogenase (E3) component
VKVEKFKNVIIGSGEGANSLARQLAKSGQKTVIVERRRMRSQFEDLVHSAYGYGLSFGHGNFNASDGLIGLATRDDSEAGGVQLIEGHAKFVGYMTVDVHHRDGSVRTLAGERIRLNLGAAELWPSITGLRLELAGIELDEYGAVRVNDRLETTCPNVWAIGQHVGRPRLNHASFDYVRIIWDYLARTNGDMREEPVRVGLDWTCEMVS